MVLLQRFLILFSRLLYCSHYCRGSSYSSLPYQLRPHPVWLLAHKLWPRESQRSSGWILVSFVCFFPQRFYIGAQCDTCFEWCLKVPAHVHIFTSYHSNHFHNPVLCYGFLFSFLISFSSFSCLCNADACWIHDLDPTYFLTILHWFYLDPALVQNVPWSSLTIMQDSPTSCIFANCIMTSSS
jgi:hypothetical protein